MSSRHSSCDLHNEHLCTGATLNSLPTSKRAALLANSSIVVRFVNSDWGSEAPAISENAAEEWIESCWSSERKLVRRCCFALWWPLQVWAAVSSISLSMPAVGVAEVLLMWSSRLRSTCSNKLFPYMPVRGADSTVVSAHTKTTPTG